MKVVLDITAQQMADLMTSAIEGDMSAAWCTGVYCIVPGEFEERNIPPKDDPWYSKPEVFSKPFKIQVDQVLDESKSPAGKNIKKHFVHSVDFAEAFQIMAEKHGHAFGEFLSGDYDSIVSDMFLQLATLKEVIYG